MRPMAVQVKVDELVEPTSLKPDRRVMTMVLFLMLVSGFVARKTWPALDFVHLIADWMFYGAGVIMFHRLIRLEGELRARMVLDAMTRNEFTWGSKPIPSKPPPPPPLPLLHTLRTDPLRGCACAQCEGLRKMRGV